MTSAVTIAVVAGLTVVALLGVVRPYRRGPVPALEPLAGPLEDRRAALLVSLRDLETSRETGAIEDADYDRLRAETEGRLIRVLRAIDRREEDDAAAARPEPERSNRARVAVVAAVLVAALGVALVPSLVRSAHDRATIDDSTSTSLAFFEERVREHPDDVAARLDLGSRYLDRLMFAEALEQYRIALHIAPRNVEALAHAGIVVHLLGNSEYGLRFEQKALRIDPGYPEALFFEGVILMRGLNRPAQAIAPLEAYLEASPYGSEIGEAKKLLREARAATR